MTTFHRKTWQLRVWSVDSWWNIFRSVSPEVLSYPIHQAGSKGIVPACRDLLVQIIVQVFSRCKDGSQNSLLGTDGLESTQRLMSEDRFRVAVGSPGMRVDSSCEGC